MFVVVAHLLVYSGISYLRVYISLENLTRLTKVDRQLVRLMVVGVNFANCIIKMLFDFAIVAKTHVKNLFEVVAHLLVLFGYSISRSVHKSWKSNSSTYRW